MKAINVKSVCLIGLTVLSILVSQVRAGVLAYETFGYEHYTVGSSLVGEAPPTSGFDGAWQHVNGDLGNDVVLETSLMADGVPPSKHALNSGSLLLTPNCRVGRFLDTSPNGPFASSLAADGTIGRAGTSIFVSFLMKPDTTSYFWAFEIKRGGLGDAQAVLYIGNDVGDPAGTVQLCAFRNRSTAPDNIGRQLQWAGDASVEPELYVLRIDFHGGAVDDAHLWRNPPLDREPDIMDAASLTAAGNLAFDGISVAAFVGPPCTFDEISIGETFYDVVSQYQSELADSPNPPDGVTDLPRDGVVLSWRAGELAASHNVYVGTNADDVYAATPASPEYRGNQTETSHVLERLEFGTTYYWRIDEINDEEADSPWIGRVWSFTTEPIAYPLASDRISVTASSVNSDEEGPENTISGWGLDGDDLHSVTMTDMWLTDMTDADPWIQFAFDKPYMLHQMLVWNHNSDVELDIGFGIREAAIEYSLDEIDWLTLGTVEFAQATGRANYMANTVVAFDGAAAQYVRILPIDNWGGILPQFGLSEVRFLTVPVSAREPAPAAGAVEVAPQVTLSWRPGRQATMHDVYLSEDEAAVAGDAAAPVASVSESSYVVDPLHLGRTYYWRVDDVNEAEDPAVWKGDVWSFKVNESIVIDDFVSYNDDDNLIYETWIDGWDDPANGGSRVGHAEAPFAERGIVYSGRQSMPLFYDNTGEAANSVAKRTFEEPQDWTQFGIQGLVLYIHGSSQNTGGRLYVEINGTKVSHDGDADTLMRSAWNKWYIPLSDLPDTQVSQVTSLSIGIDSGGQGLIFVDAITLTPDVRHLLTPVEPDVASLVAYWDMDEGPEATTLVDRVGGNNATVHSGWTGVAGKYGNAIEIGGASEPITAPDTGLPSATSPCTISVWFKQTSEFIHGNGVLVSYGTTGAESGVNGQYRALAKNNASAYRVFHWDADMPAGVARSPAEPDVWHHLAFTFDPAVDVQAVHLNGVLIGSAAIPDAVDVALNGKLIIGDMDRYDQIFNGWLDELRIYDRALSLEEIAWLAGHRTPFDQ